MKISEAIRLYYSLKLHFSNEKYDYFKYNGKTNIDIIENKNLGYFHILANRYIDLESFYVANFLKNNTMWLDELVSQESHDTYLKYIKTHQSLMYIFKNDVESLIPIQEKIIASNGNYPILMKKVLQNKIHLETLLLMNSVLKFFHGWDGMFRDDLVWMPFRLKCIKYYPFLSFDKDKIKSLLSKIV